MESPKCKECGERHWSREPCKVKTAGTRDARALGDRSRAGRQQQGLPAPRLRRESGGVTPTAQKTQAIGVKRAEVQGSATVAKGVEGPLSSKIGRPLDKDRASAHEATKPWLVEGLSRATWYRRRAEKRAQ